MTAISEKPKYVLAGELVRGERRWFFIVKYVGNRRVEELHKFGSHDRRTVERRIAKLNSEGDCHL